MKRLFLFIFTLAFANFPYCVFLDKNLNEPCTTPDRKSGTCVHIDSCPALKSAQYRIRNGSNIVPEIEKFLNDSTCMWDPITNQRVVCCQEERVFGKIPRQTEATNNNSILPDPPDHCGITFTNRSYSRIVRGFPVDRGQFPWIVAIGYNFSETSIPNPFFLCGGSLITANHVLTAAHCVQDAPLSIVRINILNPYKEKGFEGQIVGAYTHEAYSTVTNENDIAILKIRWNDPNVENLIRNSDGVTPICLPKSPEMKRNLFERYTPFVAGWGRTEFNKTNFQINTETDLMALQLPVWPQNKCKNRYRTNNEILINSDVLCAGFTKERRDSCKGDSGGPLMLPYLVNGVIFYFQVGIISKGIGCAIPGSPAIYTRVTSYIPWIQLKINQL